MATTSMHFTQSLPTLLNITTRSSEVLVEPACTATLTLCHVASSWCTCAVQAVKIHPAEQYLVDNGQHPDGSLSVELDPSKPSFTKKFQLMFANDLDLQSIQYLTYSLCNGIARHPTI